MGEEVKMTDYESGSGAGTGSGDEDRVFDWESGLPGFDDLTPLSQTLIPPDLMSAFRISPEPSRSMVDVNRESQKTFTSIRAHHQFHSVSSSPTAAATAADAIVVDDDDTDPIRKARRITDNGGATEDGDSSAAPKCTENGGGALKRPRLVWTPQLHKRFVDVVAHLGIKNAVPKTIMQLMNVEGLTRENVASHLQKYRLYLKRMQGLSSEGPTSSDQLFASTPVPQSLHEPAASGAANGHMPMPMPMPYPPPAPVPMMGGGFHGFEAHHQYGMMHMQPMDWSGNKYPYQHLPHQVAPNEN